MHPQTPSLEHPEGQGRKAYKDYVTALERLLDGTPTEPSLIEFFEENGYVPITQKNVALEAGRKRTAISGKSCRYPHLAASITSLRTTHGVKQTTTALIQRLQAEAREWKHREKVLCSKIAEKTIELSDARRDLMRAGKDVKRLRQKKAA